MGELFRTPPMAVLPEWIDFNGHLNMAYYSVLFDRSADAGFAALGLGPDYAKTRRHTTYTAEFHISYVRELHVGDTVWGTFQLIDYDAKRPHTYQELFHADGWLAAAAETLSLHVDMAGPKVASFLPDIAEKVAAMQAGHADLPRPARAGRSIGIRRASL